ncbi:alpha-1,2-fucosyltransferase [Algoriphagus boritolerans]|uniref:Glycosyl transferase family 11 n=1 Tax=Algoriphagus boritolerans DSM 17298 = JCM 18970 TaxID=1120964 RepID=A0A1H6A8A9_9BACT|nr:alpha-1,2-fucosyltransferase [Algoriphagus boritolerans]SEG43966.1 Glycosyl transferase family 11 [Algoriphagus boritolerans DSM 17298 = JCM 18970]
MIIVKFLGGLGNQIFQYVHGRKLADERGTFIASDIHTYSIFRERDFILDKFQVKIKHLPRKVINFLSKPYLKKLDQISAIKLYHHFIEEPQNEFLNLLSSKNLYLRGYWTWNAYFDDFVENVSQELELKPRFTSKFYLKNKEQVKSVDSVGIHIRRGDYASNTQYNQYFGLTPITYYESAIKLLTDKINNPIFYVFSDDPDWVKSNMHFLSDAVFAEDLCEHQDYLEFDLLKSCKHQIIANSTFSWWASRLNPNPDKIIIQPKKWYNDQVAQKIYEDKKAFYQPQAIII